jgi:Tol biopolymer transport system component
MITALVHRRMVLVAIASTFACAGDSGELPSGVPVASLQVADDPPRFSDWSAPVNLGPSVNTTLADVTPANSKDGLSLYFSAGTGPGNFDIHVSRRASLDAAWGRQQNLGMTVNSVGDDDEPVLSTDGHRLYFGSNRGGGFGGTDLYVSWRRDKRDDFGWEAPVNLGSGVNTAANEVSPTFYEDDATGTLTMYFESNRVGGPGNEDIYTSTLLPDGTFGPAVVVASLSSTFRERQPTVRRDGREIIFASTRPEPGRVAMLDLMVATRAKTSEPWSPPVYLGPVVNGPFVDGSPGLSFDGTALYFHSNGRNNTGPCFGADGSPPCAFDIWVSTRSKLRGSN